MNELGQVVITVLSRISPETKKALLALPDEQLGRVFRGVLCYFRTGHAPPLDPDAQTVFEAVRRDMGR